MNKKLAAFSKEVNLKPFYSRILDNPGIAISEDDERLLVNLAPFLRKFAATYINYFELKKCPPLNQDSQFENRLEEFYADLCEQVMEAGADDTILWLLTQKASEDRLLFPSKPVVKNYSDISRGLNLLDELLKQVPPTERTVYDKLMAYITAILSPEIDIAFERRATALLDRLQAFNAREEGTESDRFRNLQIQVTELNREIDQKLLSNNIYVSIGQQLAEINKALKSVFKKNFSYVFRGDQQRLGLFWSGLKNMGYAGGDKCANGNYLNNLNQVHQWLEREFPAEKEKLLSLLDQAQKTDELPLLAREPIPEAIQIYALKLLGTIGLNDGTAVKLVLGFYSRFVGKMVRDGALQTLRKNSDQVRLFFYKGLDREPDYDQKVLIAEKHDSIFNEIPAESLTLAFGKAYAPVLQELDLILEHNGFLLSNFIKSAYLKTPEQKDGTDQDDAAEDRLAHYVAVTRKLEQFKQYVEARSPGVFIHLFRMWGLNYIVSWSLADYHREERLFDFIIEAAKKYTAAAAASRDQVIPLNDIIQLLTHEPDARGLIEKLMTFLLNSKISFDFPLFKSLFQVVAQRNIQLKGNIVIRDGFSEQRGYAGMEKERSQPPDIQLLPPHIFHPIVVFLITVLKMKAINIPKDAFIETDISLYLNTLCARPDKPRLGYEVFLARQLISGIPYIVDFASRHEGIIRKTIADLDESYNRTNTLVHYLRLKIHRAPSKLDLVFCLEILEGLAAQDLHSLLHRLTGLMRGIGDEAIPDLEHYFDLYSEKLLRLGRHLKDLKDRFPDMSWHQVAENSGFEEAVHSLDDIDEESRRDILALVPLESALSNYWTQRINNDFINAVFINEERRDFDKSDLEGKLRLIASKRDHYTAIVNRYAPDMEPYQHIFLKRHVIQCEWNFDFFGFWPFYSESKFEAYNIDRKLSLLERHHLEQMEEEISKQAIGSDPSLPQAIVILKQKINMTVRLLKHLSDEGLTPSKFFLDTIDILEGDQLTISQLSDIIRIILYRELAHIESFFADTFGHFPEKITRALGRENLDYGLDLLSAGDEELLYPLVMETVLGNLIADAHPIFLLERFLTGFNDEMLALRRNTPGQQIFTSAERPLRPVSPVFFGYKAYALITLKEDGFNVPELEVLPVSFFQQHLHLLKPENRHEYRIRLIRHILNLEKKTGKCFYFNQDRLSVEEHQIINDSRTETGLDPSSARQLLISARSGSYRSLPGILGTVVNIGDDDFIERKDLPPEELCSRLNTYRMFLSTFGNVVFGINEIEFSKIVTAIKQQLQGENTGNIRWENLSSSHILTIVYRFRELIEKTADKAGLAKPDWDDPLSLLLESTIGVWNSWDSEAACNLRNFLGISDDWKTAVILMEMKLADRNQRSFSAILFSGDPQGKYNRPHGDILFGRPGEDIAAGLASGGDSLESLEDSDPGLYGQIVDLLEAVKINKGNINVDVEMVGEYDTAADRMELYIVQERQMPLGKRAESEDYRLMPTDEIPAARGQGVNGGVQYGVFLDGVGQNYYELKETAQAVREALGPKDEFHGPAIFLLMKYVTPDEALKMNIPGVDGIITTKIGKSSHASISAKRDGKLFVCEASIRLEEDRWMLNGREVVTGDRENPDIFTVVANPKSISPYSGNIYHGKMPLARVQPSRQKRRKQT